MNSEGVSTISSVMAPFQLLIVLLVPPLGKLVLYKDIFGFCAFIYGICCILYPLIAQLYQQSEIVSIIFNYSYIVDILRLNDLQYRVFFCCDADYEVSIYD